MVKASGTEYALSRNIEMDWQLGLRTSEPFDAGPLQRHGGRLAGPAAHAVRCGKPDFAPPHWPSGQRALRRFSTMFSGALGHAVRERLLCVWQLRDWQQARQAMETVFGFHHAHHFFHAAPLGWVSHARLTEPQVTKAIAYFLHSQDHARRGARIRALLSALGYRPDEMGTVLRKARATAEALVDDTQQRINLLVEWLDDKGGDRGAVIEAKFGHDVTKGQLKTYQRHLLRVERRYTRAEHIGGPEPPLLFIVSPYYRKSDAHALARNRGWRWKSWRSLLLAWDRFLDPRHDDEAFRQFRRTLWDRVGQ